MAKRVTVYRVQDADGRGPWKPGFSKYWIDDASERTLREDVLSAFGREWISMIPHGWSAGCACRSMDALLAWFTQVEQERLEYMGYKPVALDAELIICENAYQVVFARRTPLAIGARRQSWEKAHA